MTETFIALKLNTKKKQIKHIKTAINHIEEFLWIVFFFIINIYYL